MYRIGLVSRTAWRNGNMEHGTELVCFPHFDQPGKWAYPIQITAIQEHLQNTSFT